jgi:hypothetical protein
MRGGKVAIKYEVMCITGYLYLPVTLQDYGTGLMKVQKLFLSKDKLFIK